MILEEADVIEYLQNCDVDEKVKLIFDSTRNYQEDADIAEQLADTCSEYLRRYKLIDDEEA